MLVTIVHLAVSRLMVMEMRKMEERTRAAYVEARDVVPRPAS
jgi:hypothetical protein